MHITTLMNYHFGTLAFRIVAHQNESMTKYVLQLLINFFLFVVDVLKL